MTTVKVKYDGHAIAWNCPECGKSWHISSNTPLYFLLIKTRKLSISFCETPQCKYSLGILRYELHLETPLEKLSERLK